MKPVIAIIGAGAVGCYYGGRLAEHQWPVHFLCRAGYEGLRSHGLAVESADGDFTLPPSRLNLYRRPADMPKADLVIVTLKTTANDQYQPLISPLLKEQTLILTLQNGLGNEDQLAALFGAERVLGGLAFVCVNRLANGTIRHLDHGQINIGEFVGPPRERTGQIAEMFKSSNVNCKMLDDLRYGRWEKLVWNVPFNGLGAVLDKSTDKLIGTAEGRALVETLMVEVIETAASQGIALPPGLPDIKIKHTRTMGAYRTSMQIDRQEGRPMEVEAILGRPLAAAKSANVLTPCLKMLYEMATLG
jgi:2-dehydropantoate 2-reductase